jgi:hypothetical protein
MRIPKKIKGFGYIYPVIQVKGLRDKEGKWDGLIDHRKGIIKLEKNVHHKRKEANLLHEIVHFVAMEASLNLKEESIDRFAGGLYQILKDNQLLR